MDVSVIISNYNNAIYLRECLDSVFMQIGASFEVIVVDDCSTDKTVFDIFDEYTKYPNFKLIRHTINQGPGVARNDGLKASKADYIMFLDSDDYWTYDHYLRDLLDVSIATGSDIVRDGWLDNGTPRLEHKSGTIISRQERCDIFDKYITTAMFSILFKHSLWDGIDYCERPYIEDTPSYIKVMLKANHITYIEKYGYYYRNNPASVTHTSSPYKKALFGALSNLDIVDECNSYNLHLHNISKVSTWGTFLANSTMYGWTRDSFHPYEKYYDELMERFEKK